MIRKDLLLLIPFLLSSMQDPQVKIVMLIYRNTFNFLFPYSPLYDLLLAGLSVDSQIG